MFYRGVKTLESNAGVELKLMIRFVKSGMATEEKVSLSDFRKFQFLVTSLSQAELLINVNFFHYSIFFAPQWLRRHGNRLLLAWFLSPWNNSAELSLCSSTWLQFSKQAERTFSPRNRRRYLLAWFRSWERMSLHSWWTEQAERSFFVSRPLVWLSGWRSLASLRSWLNTDTIRPLSN